MKNLYPKNKGKVYPSPSSSSIPQSSPNRDALSVLKLLPAAILALASVLSLEDREVLAYMITRSMKTTNPSSMIEEKKKCKKSNTHKPPIFDCGCFDCYTSYWFRWDSSPNRELIHQAIEAFEEHLTNGELSKKNTRGKKKDKARRVIDKPADKPEEDKIVSEKEPETPDSLEPEPELEKPFVVPENDAFPVLVSEDKEEKREDYEEGDVEYPTGNLSEMALAVQVPGSSHKGLARKVLPDVLGLFNSRLWSLWSPAV